MIEWNCIVILLCIGLLLFLLWQEVKRANKARLPARLAATVFAAASLGALALPITYRHKENITISNEAVLLTGSFNSDSVNKFLSVHANSIPVLTTEKNMKDAAKYNATYIADVSSLFQQRKDISVLHVFGNGLQQDELNLLKNTSILFHPSEPAAGITSVSWPAKIKTGDKFFIRGSFHNSLAVKAKIVLSSFNTALDSMYVAAGKHENFELSVVPKHSGRAVYSLVVTSGKEIIEKEPVPVQVQQGDPLKVLLLASSPDFENRFLQNYLSHNGYQVAARTAISKNKYLKDFLNISALPIDHITPSLLDKFDITIADAAELAAIGSGELAAIQAQVAQKSMGLIIKADSVSKSAFYTSRFPLTASANTAVQSLDVYLPDTTTKLPVLNIENPLFIRNQPGTQPVVSDRQSSIFVNAALYGSGKIILTTIPNTYNWALSGNQDEYAKFWSALLNKVAAKPVANEVWSVAPALPQVNQSVQLQVETNNPGIPAGQVNGAAIYLKESADLPYQWSGTYYPVKAGWQTGIQLNGNAFYWFAFDVNNWKNIQAAQTIEATKRYVAEHAGKLEKEKEGIQLVEDEIPKVIFFLIFLLCAGFLWFENKM